MTEPEPQPERQTLRVGPRHLASVDELHAVYSWRAAAFTTWYASPRCPWWRARLERHATNSLAAHYPDTQLEARDERGVLVGVLFAAPLAWDGDPTTLTSFDRAVRGNYWRALSPLNLLVYVVLVLVVRAPALHARVAGWLHRRELARRDSVVFLEMLVAPEAQRQGVASQLLDEAVARARARRCRFVVGPFRPSGYGRFKASGQRAHSAAGFRDYCRAQDGDGRVLDPWLRVLSSRGVELVSFADPSVVVGAPRAVFERFRAQHRSSEWYETSPGTWECGETQTWVVGPRWARSFEPNVWGVLRLRP